MILTDTLTPLKNQTISYLYNHITNLGQTIASTGDKTQYK